MKSQDMFIDNEYANDILFCDIEALDASVDSDIVGSEYEDDLPVEQKLKINLKLSSKKSSDKRAHINRNNWNEELASALIAQVELHPGLFFMFDCSFFILLTFHSYLGCKCSWISKQNSKTVCVDESALRWPLAH